jgi:hypothetical protein
LSSHILGQVAVNATVFFRQRNGQRETCSFTKGGPLCSHTLTFLHFLERRLGSHLGVIAT